VSIKNTHSSDALIIRIRTDKVISKEEDMEVIIMQEDMAIIM
jgi:hypothetical protein